MISAPATDHRDRRFSLSGKYEPPREYDTNGLTDLVDRSGRSAVAQKQLALLGSKDGSDVTIFSSGDIGLLSRKTVAIVGSRAASQDGQRRAARLARELSQREVVVSSGLAKGIDAAALVSAITCGGSVIAVIGTPLEKAYPAENKRLQEEIYREHLLLTPFAPGQRVYPSNFPQRNRVMALLSDATVIIEATNTSGTLHQAAECIRQNRHLFIAKSVMDDPSLTWPDKFLGEQNVHILESTDQLVEII